jgi:Fe-S-cluster containining protein
MNDPMKVYETTSLFNTFFHQLPTYNDKEMLVAILDETIEDFEATLKDGATPADIAPEINLVGDALLKKAATDNPESENITCRVGCAHCCRQSVAIVRGEADALIKAARFEGVDIDMDKLKRQAVCQNSEDWQRLAEADRDCVFLKDNRCSVYASRPLSCRKYLVTSEPELCNIDKYPGLSVPMIFNLDVEILTSAAMTACETGFMPQMLLDVLNPQQVHT